MKLIIVLVLTILMSVNGLKLSVLKRSFIAVVASTSISISSITLPSIADSSTLTELLKQLDDNNVSKVVFRGITPTSASVYLKNSESILEVPLPFDDPKSPSGPAQVIARVQHTPGVICQQDIGDILKTTKKKNVAGIQNAMFLSGQSPYPTKSDTPVKL